MTENMLDIEAKNLLSDGVSKILKGFELLYGIDPKDCNFKDTPERVAKALLEMTQGTNSKVAHELLDSRFDSDYNGMITELSIPCFSICPHHLLPVRYVINFAYMPNKYMLGLSKVPRFIKLTAQAPMLQEDYTKRVIDEFVRVVEPKGAMIFVKGWHGCMGARGVEMPSVATVTSLVYGTYEEQSIKDEFYQIINNKDN